jgi:hypothetical protein
MAVPAGLGRPFIISIAHNCDSVKHVHTLRSTIVSKVTKHAPVAPPASPSAPLPQISSSPTPQTPPPQLPKTPLPYSSVKWR